MVAHDSQETRLCQYTPSQTGDRALFTVDDEEEIFPVQLAYLEAS